MTIGSNLRFRNSGGRQAFIQPRHQIATCNTSAWAAIATKGSEAQRRFRAWRPRLGAQKAAWAVAHYQIRIVWKVLHDGVRYRQPDTEALPHRTLVGRAERALAELRKLGYAVSITPPSQAATSPLRPA